MALYANLEGTGKTQFTVGYNEVSGIRELTGQIALFDPVSGVWTLAQILEHSASAQIDKLIITTEGGVVYHEDGELVVQA